jgi:hypothetical protein
MVYSHKRKKFFYTGATGLPLTSLEEYFCDDDREGKNICVAGGKGNYGDKPYSMGAQLVWTSGENGCGERKI